MKNKVDEIKKIMDPEMLEFYENLQKIKIQESNSAEICIICYNS